MPFVSVSGRNRIFQGETEVILAEINHRFPHEYHKMETEKGEMNRSIFHHDDDFYWKSNFWTRIEVILAEIYHRFLHEVDEIDT